MKKILFYWMPLFVIGGAILNFILHGWDGYAFATICWAFVAWAHYMDLQKAEEKLKHFEEEIPRCGLYAGEKCDCELKGKS